MRGCRCETITDGTIGSLDLLEMGLLGLGQGVSLPRTTTQGVFQCPGITFHHGVLYSRTSCGTLYCCHAVCQCMHTLGDPACCSICQIVPAAAPVAGCLRLSVHTPQRPCRLRPTWQAVLHHTCDRLCCTSTCCQPTGVWLLPSCEGVRLHASGHMSGVPYAVPF